MRVTGYQIREKLRDLDTQRELLYTRLANCIYAFPGQEDLPDPVQIAHDIVTIEQRIARLQVAQDMYNILVIVKAGDRTLTLAAAIASMGGFARLAKAFRLPAIGKLPGRHRYDDDILREGEVKKVYRISQESAHEYMRVVERNCSALREAVAQGNVTELDVSDLMVDLQDIFT